MAFTDTVALSDALRQSYDSLFLIANGQDNVMEQLVQGRTVEGAVSINMMKYDRVAPSVAVLSETVDPTAVALSGNNIPFTPQEHGQISTITNLLELQAGSQPALQAVENLGFAASSAQNLLATTAGLSTTNFIGKNGKVANGTDIAVGDIMDASYLSIMYNKLNRSNVRKINGAYVLVAHADQIEDLKKDASVGSWNDASKYTDSSTILANEMGMFKGFRVIQNNDLTVSTNSNGFVDSYRCLFMGANGLGKATSQPVAMYFKNDSIFQRRTEMGWYGVFNYGIIDAEAIYSGVTSSSFANNAT